VKIFKRLSAIALAVMLSTVGLGLVSVAPAQAANTAIVDLQNVPSTQVSVRDMSIVDSRGNTFWFSVTTTWTRHSSTSATLGSIILRPKSFPSGLVMWPEVYYRGTRGTPTFYSTNRTLSTLGYLTYRPNITISAGEANLGQLTIRTPDPWAPLSGGARSAYIEYHT